MRIEHVIFDLDGTLVDSARDIEETLAWALAQAGHAGAALQGFRVGPPLEELVRRCAPPGLSEAGVAAIIGLFRQRYDALDFSGTRLFDGVEAVLARLGALGVGASVATLKRAAPTLRLLELKGLSPRFQAVACLDSLPGPAQSKQEMIERLCRELRLTPARTLLVGDTPEDLRAARAAGVTSAWVSYGYGDPTLVAEARPGHRLERLPQLLDLI
jgi:phosphoglycolate phosphatase